MLLHHPAISPWVAAERERRGRGLPCWLMCDAVTILETGGLLCAVGPPMQQKTNSSRGSQDNPPPRPPMFERTRVQTTVTVQGQDQGWQLADAVTSVHASASPDFESSARLHPSHPPPSSQLAHPKPSHTSPSGPKHPESPGHPPPPPPSPPATHTPAHACRRPRSCTRCRRYCCCQTASGRPGRAE